MARPATQALLIVTVLTLSMFGLDCGGEGPGEPSSTAADLVATTTMQAATSTATAPATTSLPPTTTPAPTPTTTSKAARPAPDFAGTTLDGTQVSLASFKGKPLLLIFWASW